MVEAELHFFQVEIELIAAHTLVAFQLGLCITPEVFNAIDVMTFARGERLLVIDAIVFEAIEH